MLVRQAHEIEWNRKSNNAKSPINYYERLKPFFNEENITFKGFIGEWEGNTTRLNLTCSKGHEFTPTIHKFLTGRRCPKCKRPNYAATKEEYYERLKPFFNEENITFKGFIGEWEGDRTRLNLICDENHEFTPTINKFLRGQRCPRCHYNKVRVLNSIAKEEYYERLKPFFNEENITFKGFIGEWKGNQTKLNLTCSKGHEFTPAINMFLRGQRCPKCKRIKLGALKSITKEEYYERLKPIFINENIKFNGFIGEWKGSKTRLNLTCSQGHEFTPIINNFLQGQRCPKCAGNYAFSKKEYYERLKPIFINENIKFNGFIGEWKGNQTKLNLTCSKGHEFTPAIYNFQSGSRCSKCTKYGYNASKKGVLYIQRLISKNIFVGVKFGITNLTTQERMRNQSRLSKFDHEIFYELTLQDGQKILDLENKIKEAMKGKTSYISKEDMPDGWTETVAPSELSTIMYIVKTFEKELTA